MTVKELAEKLELTVFNMGSPDREVSSGYAGDLLSWVMGRAEMDSAWVTIMSNKNVAAVALMADVSCAVLSEGVQPDADMLERAKMEELNILGTDKSTFEMCAAIAQVL